MDYHILFSMILVLTSSSVYAKPLSSAAPSCPTCPPETTTIKTCSSTNPRPVCSACPSGTFLYPTVATTARATDDAELSGKDSGASQDRDGTSQTRASESQIDRGAQIQDLTCKPCSVCAPTNYVYEQCSAEQDTVCKRCWFVSHRNPDYLSKCRDYYAHLDIEELEKNEGQEIAEIAEISENAERKQKEYDNELAKEVDIADLSASDEVFIHKLQKKQKHGGVYAKDGSMLKHPQLLDQDLFEYEMFGDEPAEAVNFVNPDIRRKSPQDQFPNKEDLEDFALKDEGLLRRGPEPGDGSGDEGEEDRIIIAPEPELEVTYGAAGGDGEDGESSGDEDKPVWTVDRFTTAITELTEDDNDDDAVTTEAYEEDVTTGGFGAKGMEPNEGAITAEEALPVLGIVIAAFTAGIVCFFVGFFIHNVPCVCAAKEKKNGEYMAASTIDDAGTYKQHQTELDFLNHNGTRQTPTDASSVEMENGATDVLSAPILEQEEGDTSMDTLLQGTLGGVGTFLKGRYQSPVDIVPAEAETDDALEKNPLTLRYTCTKPFTITNTGLTIKISLEPDNGCELRGGPLGDRVYLLDHVHVHWGSSDERGSEHTVNGRQYAAELHLVHWNSTDYSSMEEACRSEGGLAVLSVLVDVGEAHQDVAAITDILASVQYKGESVQLDGEELDLVGLLPDNYSDYWTYTGSLTLPPYNESVTWLLFKQPIEVAPEQMHEFRKLVTYERDEGHTMNRRSTAFLVDNFRNTQPLEGRLIRASFM